MLLKTETIWMVVGIAGSVYFVITIVLFIYCKIRNITCCHKTNQESSTEFITDNTSRYPKFDREEDIRESAVCGDQDPTLQRYVKNPTTENNLRVKELDEQGEPKYDYATTREIFRGTGKTSKKSQNEKEKVTVHYENEIVDTSVKKPIDDTENESASDTHVQMRKTDSASGQYENEGAKISSNERNRNESNVYESVYVVSDKTVSADKDFEANNDDCMATSDNGISDNMSHKKITTDRENGNEQNNENLPTSNNDYIENIGNENSERLGNSDSYRKRDSQGSGQSNKRRKSDESEESNDSNNSGSSDISVRSDNARRKPAPPTNPGQDNNINVTSVNISGKYVHYGNIINVHMD